MKICSLSFLIVVAWISALQAQSSPWVTAYYAGWSQGRYNNGVLPAGEIDFSALTHIIHFAILPNADGSLDTTVNNLVETNSAALVSRAHAAGKKAIICIGGWGSSGAFREATGLLNRSRFINNLVGFMQNRGYDGIDIDWEPLEATDVLQFTLFITEFRLRMNAINPRPLLTTAVNYQATAFTALFDLFDQINIMTYDLSGAWPGWVTWHTAPLYNGGSTFPSTGGPLPSASDMINKFESVGIPANKLGIGVPFYGYVWSGGGGTPTGGVTQPRQTWTTTPKVRANVPYAAIIQDYYKTGSRRWDNVAEVSYLSIDKPDSTQDMFISFDDEQAIWKKFEFVRTNNLGGVFIWELGGGHRTDLPAGQRDRLLQSVKQAYNGSTPPQIDTIPPALSLVSPANGATVSDILNVAADATDDIGVIGVLFKADGNVVDSEDTLPPYTTLLNTAQLRNGIHTIEATARDAAGNTSNSVISITTSNTILDTIPPVISINSPPAGTTLSNVVTLIALATDWGGIANVQFQADGSNLGDPISTPPYQYSWNTASVLDGSHTISAVATDSAGNKTVASISVIVLNALLPTTPTLLSPPDGATGVELAPVLRWNAATNATTYDVQISTAENFSIGLIEQPGLSGTSLALSALLPNTMYFWRVRAANSASTTDFSTPWRFATGTPTSVGDLPPGIPSGFVLFQNFPNPFNYGTHIIFGLPEISEVSISISDVLGREVMTLPTQRLPAGYHNKTWDGTNASGYPLSSGIYFYCVIATSSSGKKFSKTMKMALMK